MDSFSGALHDHLSEEPQTIADLIKYNTAENPIDILGIAKAAGKKQVSVGLLFNILPVFFLNMEFHDFEDGMWNGAFPPGGKPVKWIMTKAAPMWQAKLWRFSSCDADFKFKQLAV